MNPPLLSLTAANTNRLAIPEIISCKEITSRYGLTLSQSEAEELVETRANALCSNGRIELAGGIINRLVLKFCDSPFLSQFNYAATLNELIETFYYFKNETLDEVDDEELLTLMKQYFDNSCQGSVELLQNRELELLAHNIRYQTNTGRELTTTGTAYFDEEEYDE
jgi:hypothetical protein